MRLSALERKILNCIQEDISFISQPFKLLSERLRIKEDALLQSIKQLKKKGIIRSFHAGLSHKRLGFKSSLVALKVPLGKVRRVAQKLSQYPEVTHCFLRQGEYNLWLVFIYKKNKLRRFLSQLVKRFGKENILNLPTDRQFKLKTKIRL